MTNGLLKKHSIKIGSFLSDSVLSILGLIFMNIALQIVLYPVLERKLGEEAFGECLHYISYVNIVAVAIGCGANHARMMASVKGDTFNGDYSSYLLCASGVICGACVLLRVSGVLKMTTVELVCYMLLFCFTMYRYYADVEYRLSVNYKKCLFYYSLIGCGYLVGIVLYRFVPIWSLPCLLGEFFGLIYVFINGSILRKNPFCKSAFCNTVWRSITTLIPALIMSNLVFNSDRIILNFFAGGAVVTTYYVASLLGKTMSMITTPLNGVIIGYIARMKGNISRRMIWCILGIVGVFSLVMSAVVWIASHIFIPFLYPDVYNIANRYFLFGNMAQVFYFSSGIMTVILLRVADEKYQLYINVVYLVVFFLVCIPSTIWMGLTGFTISFLVVNIFRLAIAGMFCLRAVQRVI